MYIYIFIFIYTYISCLTAYYAESNNTLIYISRISWLFRI